MEFQYANRMSCVNGSAIADILRYAGDPTVISLAGGNPAPETFPAPQLADLAKEILQNNAVMALQYNQPRGYGPLREIVAQRVLEKEGIGGASNQLIIVSGSQQTLDFAAKALCNEGDVVLVEEPSYVGALNAFRSYGARLVGVPMEQDGMSIEKLEEAIKENQNIKMLYTIPTFQNPSGITMSPEKRRAVYALCEKHNIVILEDNPYGELTFTGEKLPTLKSMDIAGIVVYCGSFSKVLSPGLRVGFAVGPTALMDKLMDCKQVNDVHTPMLSQMLVYEYLKRYDMDAAIEKMCTLYKNKCAVMMRTMERCFPSQVTHTNPQGGLFVWCDLGGNYDTRAVALECAKQKVVFVPGSTFMVNMDAPCSAFRLNFSTMTDERIVEGVELLGKALHGILDKTNSKSEEIK